MTAPRPVRSGRFAPAPTIGARAATSARRTARSVGAIRIPEAVLFFALTAAGGLPGYTSIGPIPTAHLVLAAICAYAMMKRPVQRLDGLAMLIPLFIAALFYIGVVSLFAVPTAFAADWETRLLRIAAVTVMVFFLASGRIEARSAIIGTFTALVVNVPLFYAGLVQDAYGGVLTGLVGDKNVAGLTYSVLGLLMLWVTTRTSTRCLVVLFSASTVWLTGSRTAIAAYLAGLAWYLLAPHLPMIGKWILGVITAVVVDVLAEDYSQIGEFSDREGSDLLRSRIDDASQLKVEDAGLLGKGLGEAYVVIEDGTWFFHNSYWSALVEGGWPWTLFVVGVTVLVLVRPFSGASPREQYVAQAAGVVLLVCATRLGEVFFTNVWGLALGVGLYLLARQRDAQAPQERAAADPDGTASVPREAR